MNYCKHCEVKINSKVISCPLCGYPLDNNKDSLHQHKTNSKTIVMRIILLLSVITSGICLLIDYNISNIFTWSKYVLGGFISFLIILKTIFKYHNHIIQLPYMLCITTSIIAIIWDLMTGLPKFSFTYIIPIITIITLGYIGLIIKIKKIPSSSYILYLLKITLLGLVSLIITKIIFIKIKLPTYISFLCCSIAIIVLLIFKRKELKLELHKYFHL